MTQEEQHDHAQDMAKRMAMAYLAVSVSNCYMQEGVDELKKLGLYRHEVKQRIGNAERYFDFYNQCIKWIFEYCGGDAKAQLNDDYDVLKEACDKFMGAEVRMTAYRYNNNDDLREEGDYLCRVTGVRLVDQLLLHWENRQWSVYSLSTVSDGWVPLKGGVRVVEVLKRIHKHQGDETQ